MRSRRAALPADEQFAAAMAVMTRLAKLRVLEGARVVAGYRAVRGEVEIDAPLQLCIDRGSIVTLPRVAGDTLEFVVHDSDAPSRRGAFGIPEPLGGRTIAVSSHDVMLVPLVAFDETGSRLGQGGGFYDRALDPVRSRPFGERPALIGVAHSFQQVPSVLVEPWDVSLDAIVTEDGVVGVTPGAASPWV